jgi:hypothetical protein
MMDEPICNWVGDSDNFNHRDNQQLKILSLNISRGNRMKEIKVEKVFKVVKGFEDYACTECGEIIKVATGKTLSQFLAGIPPYYSVNLASESGRGQQRVHRVVALAWLHNDDPINKIQVNHIDGDKFNNHVSNLEWVTPSQNQQHALKTGLKGRGGNVYNSLLTEPQVHEICKLLCEGFTTKDIADKYELPRSLILKLRCGDVYPHIRTLYDISVKSKDSFSESTVRWICEKIVNGFGDEEIVKLSSNSKLSPGVIRKIRHKIRYQSISCEYF